MAAPCDEALPILWPAELPESPEKQSLQRRGSDDSDGTERGPAQRWLQRRIQRARERGEPPPSPCFEDDTDPNQIYDAHHMQPLYLDGYDVGQNLCALETFLHHAGHHRLNDQSEMAEGDATWFHCGVEALRLNRHPREQTYKIEGEK